MKTEMKTETSKAILDKLKKIQRLALSASKIGSLAESEAATMAINRLLIKYNLSLFDIEEHTDSEAGIELEIKCSRVLSVINKYGRVWKESLLAVLSEYNYCKVIRSGRQAFLVGTLVNTSVVIDMFNTLQSIYLRSAKECHEQAKTSFSGGQFSDKYKCRYITSYLLACPMGLLSKLKKEYAAQAEVSCALALSHKQIIDDYISKNMELSDYRPKKRVPLLEDAYEKGYEKGAKTSPQRSVV